MVIVIPLNTEFTQLSFFNSLKLKSEVKNLDKIFFSQIIELNLVLDKLFNLLLINTLNKFKVLLICGKYN